MLTSDFSDIETLGRACHIRMRACWEVKQQITQTVLRSENLHGHSVKVGWPGQSCEVGNIDISSLCPTSRPPRRTDNTSE